MTSIKFMWWGLLIAIGLALFISPFASSFPDGLERVAEDHGFIEKGEVKFFKAPMPDYNPSPVAGAIGTLIMFGLGYGIASTLKKSAS